MYDNGTNQKPAVVLAHCGAASPACRENDCIPVTSKAQSPKQEKANKLSVSRKSKCIKYFKTLTQKAELS